MWWLALALFLSCIIEVSCLLLSFSNAKWIGLEILRGINLPTPMTLNGSTYSQSVRSCVPILNGGHLLITVLSIRTSIRLWNCRTQFGNSRCWSHTTYPASINCWPTFQQNYSLSGEFNTLTKLIFCVVMIRGRHRGLPAAIDRAVMLPAKLQQTDDLIRENRSQHSIEECARATSCGVSTPPISGSLQASSVHQRVRTISRGLSATNVW